MMNKTYYNVRETDKEKVHDKIKHYKEFLKIKDKWRYMKDHPEIIQLFKSGFAQQDKASLAKIQFPDILAVNGNYLDSIQISAFIVAQIGTGSQNIRGGGGFKMTISVSQAAF